MSARKETFLVEPEKWAFEAEEVRVDEARMRALLKGPDRSLTDFEVTLALLELLHAEITEMAAEDYGLLTRAQVSLAFNALHATAHRAGWVDDGHKSDRPLGTAARIGDI
jgi:hypothetical protein